MNSNTFWNSPLSGSKKWKGRVVGSNFSEATFVDHGSTVAGSISTHDSVYSVVIRSNGVGYTSQRTWSSFPREECAHASKPPASPPTDSVTAAPAKNTAATGPYAAAPPPLGSVTAALDIDDGTEFTIMFVYTRKACCAIAFNNNNCDVTTCKTAANAVMALAVAETNTGYRNSGINAKLRLVYSDLEPAYDEASGDYDKHLDRLASDTDGFMDFVHDVRNGVQADFVSLIVSDPAYCGMGYVGGNGVPVSQNRAFTVVDSTCVTGYYSLGHELGQASAFCAFYA